MYKKIFLIILVVVSLLILVSCQNSEPVATEETMNDSEAVEVIEADDHEEGSTEVALEFTIEELKEYNGKDGQRSYVAVDGIVYDVTDVPEWQNGMHNGQEAGKDVTEAIKNISPHGTSMLSKAEKVGYLK